MKTAADVIKRANKLLVDDNILWSLSELCGWFNDAVLAVANRRPDAVSATVVFRCAQGTEQSIPDDGLRFLRVLRNEGGSKQAITPQDLHTMNRLVPEWHSEASLANEAKQYLVDETLFKTFFLYPAVAEGTEVKLVYAKCPDAINDMSDLATDSQPIPIDSTYANAILDFLLYRAYSKDLPGQDLSGKAANHFSQFRAHLGEKIT